MIADISSVSLEETDFTTQVWVDRPMTVKRWCMKLTFKGLSGNSYINDSRRYDCWSFVRAFLCARNASRAWFLWLTGLATRSSRISSRKSLNRSWNTARHQDSRKKLQQTNRQPNEKRINKQMRCGPDKFTNEKQKAKSKNQRVCKEGCLKVSRDICSMKRQSKGSKLEQHFMKGCWG